MKNRCFRQFDIQAENSEVSIIWALMIQYLKMTASPSVAILDFCYLYFPYEWQIQGMSKRLCAREDGICILMQTL
jgi:hypothetical protein